MVYLHSDLRLEDLSLATADIIINFPRPDEQFCENTRNISKYICVKISQELEEEKAKDGLTEHETSSDSEYEYIDY